jgi:hypothetical protein
VRRDVGKWGNSRKPITNKEMALLRKAAREKWGVPNRLRTQSLCRIDRLLCDPESSDRDMVAAVKTLAALDALDLDSAKHAFERRKHREAGDGGKVEVTVRYVDKDLDGRPSEAAPGPAAGAE